MFGFHRPKVYRSTQGCCICKAKSSSSRFTDSRRYEAEFESCFGLVESRSGEICNACVLLVKRWKKLPAGSDRTWNHVVDAHGPGIKTTLKPKKLKSNFSPRNIGICRVKETLKKQSKLVCLLFDHHVDVCAVLNWTSHLPESFPLSSPSVRLQSYSRKVKFRYCLDVRKMRTHVLLGHLFWV
uniref:SIN3-HDAC complex associated factor n=1 Tax=Eptatretus burgeri TaxID=7764 RepID=A0A8C4NI41_EPTBU